MGFNSGFKGLNAELIPICHLLALVGAHPIFHVSRLRVKDRPSAVISCGFSVVIEIISSSHFSSRPVCSGTNSPSVCGAELAAQCLNMRDDFYGFIVIFKNNDSL